MQSKQQDVAKANISPALFLTVDGEPMYFFLRPGPVKRKLQPLITSGGGMMCSVQQPGAILLIDQDERGTVPETAAHWYVSINYIYDCIEKGRHLNVDDYRLNPEDIPRQSARLMKKEGSSRITGGRTAYTFEEDAAILSYVSKHKSERGGNRLWQEMQKQHVTRHSWQSMKYRYRVQLAKTLSDAEEEEKQETEVPKSSSENAASPQTHSPQTEALQTELTQKDDQPVTAANVVEPEEPRVDPQEDASSPADSTEPEAAEAQAAVSPQKQNVPEDSLFSLFTPEKQKEQHMASPKRKQQPQRRSMRRQLEASSSPEPYGKNVRLSNSGEELSPHSAKEIKTAVVKKHTTTDPVPSKRARGTSVAAAAESEESGSGGTVVSETAQTEEESNPLEKAETKNGKRKFGILELAAKEFEDESESEEEATDFQNQPQNAAIPTTTAEPPLQSSDATAEHVSAQSQPTEAGLLREAQQTQAASSDSAPEKGCPEPAASEPAASGPAASGPAASGPAASDPEASDPEASDPEASDPEASDPEASDPEASDPPASDPPASDPPASDPPASDPPASDPPASDPPASDPPASHPPASHPPASHPPASHPPASGPAASGPAASGPAASGPAASGPAASGPAASVPAACGPAACGPAASRAHLFIFDNETQEEYSQSLLGDNATALSNPQPPVSEYTAPSLTQMQVEEDVQQLSALMNQTNQDIVNVTKALLRTSGDVSAALDLLLNPSAISGPFWNRHDDGLLMSADPVVRRQLQEKYGEKELAKRIVFLELEG